MSSNLNLSTATSSLSTATFSLSTATSSLSTSTFSWWNRTHFKTVHSGKVCQEWAEAMTVILGGC